LPPILVTLDDIERLNRVFYGFLTTSGCETFKARIAPKLIEMDRQAAF